jgi:hypothetical protein
LCNGGFQRWLYTHEWHVGVSSPQIFNGHSCGRVARHHNGFDWALRQQLLRDDVAAFNHKRITALTVRRMAAVGPVNETRLRHLCTQGLQHTEAANAAVKNANEA